MNERNPGALSPLAKSDPVIQAILNSGVSLPVPNTTLLQLQAAMANERSGPRDLADVLHRDPSLTGTLMRVANSPVFRPRTPARSVLDAVTMLGRTKTLAVAVSASLRGHVEEVDVRVVAAIWARSAIVADWAFRAAQLCGRSDIADSTFLTALMHDIGIPVVLRRYPEHTASFVAHSATIDAAALAMDAATGADHAAVAALVAQNWKLPPSVATALRVHHAPAAAQALDAHSQALAILVAFARRVLDGETEEWAAWQPLAEAKLGVDAAMVETLTHLRQR